MAASPVEYTIGGVKIHFPRKAYPSQLAMMNSIIRGLNYGQHCLLESPTGSGKSLALLCSTLGWQRAQLAKLQEGGSTGDDKTQSDKHAADCKKSDVSSLCQCVCHSKTCRASAAAAAEPAVVDLTVSPRKETAQQPPAAPEHVSSPEESQPKKKSIASRLSEMRQSSVGSVDDDFQPDRKRIRTAEHKGRKRQRLEQGVVFIDDDDDVERENEPPSQRWASETKNPAAGLSSSSCGTDSMMLGSGLCRDRTFFCRTPCSSCL